MTSANPLKRRGNVAFGVGVGNLIGMFYDSECFSVYASMQFCLEICSSLPLFQAKHLQKEAATAINTGFLFSARGHIVATSWQFTACVLSSLLSQRRLSNGAFTSDSNQPSIIMITGLDRGPCSKFRLFYDLGVVLQVLWTFSKEPTSDLPEVSEKSPNV